MTFCVKTLHPLIGLGSVIFLSGTPWLAYTNFILFYILLIFFLFIPLLVLCIYLTYCLFKPCYARITISKSRKKQISANDEPPPENQAPSVETSFTTVSLHDYIADDLYADRVLNPDEYKKQ